jgi:hypothetical protein
MITTNKILRLYVNEQIVDLLSFTQSISNYKIFDFSNIKFDHSSYLKIYVKYHFLLLWLGLVIKVLQK